MNKKRKWARAARISAVALSCVLFGGCLFGCGDNSGEQGGETYDPTTSPADVWYAPATQKIRQDLDDTQYNDVKMQSLNVKTGKAEYESAQIVMSPTRNISDYELELSELTLQGDSSVKFSAENIEVYNQRYIEVVTPRETSPQTTPGWYPDALVPFEAAKSYHENKAEKDNNQSIWVTFHTPKTQAAGTYTGSFKLKMDGYTQTVPVTLTVWDFDFAATYTAQNCFLIDWTSFSYGELDSSESMYDAYARALLDYRLQPGLLMNDYAKSDPADIRYYAEKAFELAKDPRCTVVFMSWDIKNDNDTYLLAETTKNYIRAFADVSFESYESGEKLNLVEKTLTYFTFIDEPTMNPNLIPRVNRAMSDFAAIRTAVHDEYLAALEEEKTELSDEEYAFRKSVIDSILEIRSVVTGPHDSRIQGVEIYCPLVDEYDSEKNREEYAKDVARWWYTAVGPRYPYPNYHIDNTSLLSARLLSWMQSEYDVIGNLYWATNLYNAYSVEEFIEDYYSYPLRYSYAGGANGDGFLFYPGKRYGVEGPVGSIRLHAIRDGLEEYETLEAVKGIYREIDEKVTESVDFSDVYDHMSENLYSGTSVYTTQAYFDDARDLMANLAQFANMGGAVSAINVSDGSVKIQLVAPKDCTLVYDTDRIAGSAVSEKTEGEYKIYDVVQPLAESGNKFICSVESGEKAISLNLNLGGAITTKNASDLITSISVGIRAPEMVTQEDLVLANTVDTTLGSDDESQWLQLKLPTADAQVRQTMLLSDADFLGLIGSNTQKLVIKIYNNRDTSGKDEGKYTYRLQFKYANSTYYTEIRQDTLKSGYNEIVIGNIFGYDWKTTGALTDIRFFFGETNGEATSDLYFIGADVYAL